MIRNLFFKNKYTIGITIGILIFLSPTIFGLLLWIPRLIFPNDCGIAGRCKHAIVEIAHSLGFGLLFLGIPLMLLGAIVIAIFTFAYGIYTLRQRNSDQSTPLRTTKLLLAGSSGVILLYLAYIPGGPDQCSRVLTASQYERCLVNLFSEMTVDKTRNWLEKAGYSISKNYSGSSGTLISNFYKTDQPYKHDFTFTGYRSYGRGRSIPYGTNLNRLFGRMWPAPTIFEIMFFGVYSEDIVFGAKAKWSFSFL